MRSVSKTKCKYTPVHGMNESIVAAEKIIPHGHANRETERRHMGSHSRPIGSRRMLR